MDKREARKRKIQMSAEERLAKITGLYKASSEEEVKEKPNIQFASELADPRVSEIEEKHVPVEFSAKDKTQPINEPEPLMEVDLAEKSLSISFEFSSKLLWPFILGIGAAFQLLQGKSVGDLFTLFEIIRSGYELSCSDKYVYHEYLKMVGLGNNALDLLLRVYDGICNDIYILLVCRLNNIHGAIVPVFAVEVLIDGWVTILKMENKKRASISNGQDLLSKYPNFLSSFDKSSINAKIEFLKEIIQIAPQELLSKFVEISNFKLKTDFISNLPVELSFEVLSYLDLKTLANCYLVSRRWRSVLAGPGSELAVWKKLLIQENYYRESEVAQALLPPYTKSNPPPHMYNQLFKKHHEITQNWYLGRGRHISFPGHGSHVVTCLQFDSQKIVSGSDDQTIHIYDTKTGLLLKKLIGHDGGVWALQYWNNILVTGSTDRTIRIWNMENGICNHIFGGHTSTVRCLQIILPCTVDGVTSPSKPLIVTGSRDATLRIWRLPDPETDEAFLDIERVDSNPYLIHVLTGHTNSVRAIAGAGNTLVSGSYDSNVRAWDLETGKCRFVYTGHTEKVYSVGYSPELDIAVSGSMDATVRIWCTKTGVPLHILEGHSSLVGLLEISNDYLISAAADATLRIWNPKTGKCLANLVGHAAAITCFHHDSGLNRIVSGSDGAIKVWELSSIGNGTRSIPSKSPLSTQLVYNQGPEGLEPVYGRFVKNLVTGVQGVWRIRMDETVLVAAVQKEGGRTWFEVIDFSEPTNEHLTLHDDMDQDDFSGEDLEDDDDD